MRRRPLRALLLLCTAVALMGCEAGPAGRPCVVFIGASGTFCEQYGPGFACSAADDFSCQPSCRIVHCNPTTGLMRCCGGGDGTEVCERDSDCARVPYEPQDTCAAGSLNEGCGGLRVCTPTQAGVYRCAARCNFTDPPSEDNCGTDSACLPHPEAPEVFVCWLAGPEPGEGSPCDSIYGCGFGMTCSPSGVCRRVCGDAEEGAPCEGGGLCTGGLCEPTDT